MKPINLGQILALIVIPALVCPVHADDSNWPQFRGPNATGISADARPPVRIGPDSGVIWQVDVPSSPSSPCVWGNQIFLTTFADGEFLTLCLDRTTGHTVWSKGIKSPTVEVFHRSEGSPAASTPATDGTTVVSYFGSVGLVAYDFQGREKWRHTLPVAQSGGSFGSGTSPIIQGNLVILNRDMDQGSTLLAFNLSDGKIAWETPRPDASGSFGTPVVWQSGGVDEIVVPGSFTLKGYELKTGLERWRFDGVTGFACPTPVVGDGLLFFAAWSPGKSDQPWPSWEVFLQMNDKDKNGIIELAEVEEANRDYVRAIDFNHDGKVMKEEYELLRSKSAKSQNRLVAIKPGGQGNISTSHLAWEFGKGLPYVPSPLVYGGRLYIVKDGGMLSSFDSKTGKAFYTQERLDENAGPFYASPVAANGHIYLLSLRGKLMVVKAGGDLPVIEHRADFGERIAATPALIGDKIYLRTDKKLYAFGVAKIVE